MAQVTANTRQKLVEAPTNLQADARRKLVVSLNMASAGDGRNDIKLTGLLIEILSEHPGGMAVNQIYNFLNKHDKAFDLSDKKWQGNVRHILSKKAYFKKTNHKEPTQRGRYWVFDHKEYTRAKQVSFH